jgi:hypothetical protein
LAVLCSAECDWLAPCVLAVFVIACCFNILSRRAENVEEKKMGKKLMFIEYSLDGLPMECLWVRRIQRGANAIYSGAFHCAEDINSANCICMVSEDFFYSDESIEDAIEKGRIFEEDEIYTMKDSYIGSCLVDSYNKNIPPYIMGAYSAWNKAGRPEIKEKEKSGIEKIILLTETPTRASSKEAYTQSLNKVIVYTKIK